LTLAANELQKINNYRAPRDKLTCVMNACKVIFGILNADEKTQERGADDFLPVLIYVTLKANPKYLHANILYIQRFRTPSKFRGEPAYFLTNLASALVFLENLRPTQLSIDPALFARRLRESEQRDLSCKSAVSENQTPERSLSKDLLFLE